MTDNILMERNSKAFGITKDDIFGITELRDDSGMLLGFYDSVLNETRDGSGVLLGNGNMLLIPQ